MMSKASNEGTSGYKKDRAEPKVIEAGLIRLPVN